MLAKEMRFIERFKARASHAAQVQSRVKKLDKIEPRRAAQAPRSRRVRFPAVAALGRGRGEARSASTRATAAAHLRGARLLDAPPRALVRDGRQRRRQVHAAQAGGRRDRAGRRPVTLGGEREARLLRPARHGSARRRPRPCSSRWRTAFPLASLGSLRSLAGAFGFSGDDVEKKCRVLSGGEKARVVLAQMLFDPPNFPVLDEPTNHLDLATKEMLIARSRTTRARCSSSRTTATSSRAVEPRPRADAGRHPRLRRRLPGSILARTGHEAPGLRS